MDAAALLFWVAMLLPAGTLIGQSAPGMKAICAAILIAGVVALDRTPGIAAWIVFALWTGLAALPSFLGRFVAAAVWRRDYARAGWLSLAVAVLHPMDGWPGQTRLFRALALMRQGRWDRAEPRLRRLAGPGQHRTTELSARSHLCNWSGDWSPFASAPDPEPSDIAGHIVRIRALGETGRLNEMAALFADASARFGGTNAWVLARLAAFAFAGRPAAIARLDPGALKGLPADFLDFWAAIARMALGGPDADSGRAAMARLATSGAPDIARSAAFRMSNPPASAALLSDQANAMLGEAEAAVAGTPSRRALPRVWVTVGLIVVLVGVFIAEIVLGGSEDSDVLLRLGALWPPAVIAGGQWWRLLTALFVHAGPIHLGLNLVALFFLGLVAEPMFGRPRFALILAVTGVGSMAGVLGLMVAGWIARGLLAGASGALMGLAGAITAAAVMTLARGGAGGGSRRLAAIGFVLATQALIDLSTPHVSFSAHAIGFVLGAVMGLMPAMRRTIVLPRALSAPGPEFDRRSFGTYAFLGLIFGTAAWLRVRYDQDQRPRLAARRVTAISREVLAGIRRLRFVALESAGDGHSGPGMPAVDPWAPFGSPRALDDLADIAGADAARDLYVAIMSGLPLFLVRAHLSPGLYDDPGSGAFRFTSRHAALVPFLVWRIVDSATMRESEIDPEDLPPPRRQPWPVAVVDPDKPYGDSKVWQVDMADILGLQFARGDDGAPDLAPDAVAGMTRLHREMPAALRIFALHARLA